MANTENRLGSLLQRLPFPCVGFSIPLISSIICNVRASWSQGCKIASLCHGGLHPPASSLIRIVSTIPPRGMLRVLGGDGGGDADGVG